MIVQVTRLRYTPRKFVVHPETNMLIVAEADHAAVPLAERSVDNMEDGNGALPQVPLLRCKGLPPLLALLPSPFCTYRHLQGRRE